MAGETPAQLAANLQKLARRLSGNVEALVSHVVREVASDLVPATPVDTGFARGNWQATLNAPAVAPITRNDPSGTATGSTHNGGSDRTCCRNVFYITNNAPYIGQLNAGSSPQAPAGFVKKAVDTATARAFATAPGLVDAERR